MNQKAKEEWDKKQAEECDKLRKVNEVSSQSLVSFSFFATVLLMFFVSMHC